MITSRPLRNTTVVCAASVLLAACGDSTGGELDNGSFQYVCASGRDAACIDGEMTTVPERIAVGGEFGMDYSGEVPDPNGDVGFPVSVVPAAPSFFGTTGDNFTALLEGDVAMLGRGSNGSVADLFHMSIAQVAELEVVDGAGQALGAGPVMLTAPKQLTVRPRAADNNLLAGSMLYAWASSDPAIVVLDDDPNGLSATVSPEASGEAVVTIVAGGITKEIAFIAGGTL